MATFWLVLLVLVLVALGWALIYDRRVAFRRARLGQAPPGRVDRPPVDPELGPRYNPPHMG